MPVIMGRISGLGIPKSWMNALGVSDHMYHIGAVYVVSFFGFATLFGMLILTYRRFAIKTVRKRSSAYDLIVNTILLLIVILAIYASGSRMECSLELCFQKIYCI